METVSISKDKFEKMKQLAIIQNTIQTNKHLTFKQIRRIQYLIKSKKSNAIKTKLYGVINLYKETKDLLLLQYILNIYKELEDNTNLLKKKDNEK